LIVTLKGVPLPKGEEKVAASWKNAPLKRDETREERENQGRASRSESFNWRKGKTLKERGRGRATVQLRDASVFSIRTKNLLSGSRRRNKKCALPGTKGGRGKGKKKFVGGEKRFSLNAKTYVFLRGAPKYREERT